MNGLKIQKGKNGKMFHIPLFASTSVPVDKRQTTGVSPVRNQGDN